MKLTDIIRRIPILATRGNADIEITGVAIDSRKVEPGNLFIAVRGTQADGHQFIPAALRAGAAAVLCEEMPPEAGDTQDFSQKALHFSEKALPLSEESAAASPAARPVFLQCASTERAAGLAAHEFCGAPSERLRLVGVTGTNGKTTIATLLYHLFRHFGYKAGLISTVCNYVDDRPSAATQTTPDPISLNRLLQEMADAGCTYAFMEVSSHAVAQHRIEGLHFAGGIFTNLTRDHLDYHKTFENYRDAKKAFFDHLPAEAFALSNLDDRNGPVMLQNTPARREFYSLRTLCDFKGKILESHFEGMLLEIDGHEVATHFVGRFNASNLLAVYGAAASLLPGLDRQEILVGLSTLRPVSGRFEAIRSPRGYTAIVDYAHTPDALANVLGAIHEILLSRGRIITVVGAGGNRDRGKRPLMAQEAAHRSDRLIITSDNPRFEKPEDIMADMLEGLTPQERAQALAIADRKEAIRTACALAQKGDVILIAGKGHENYQEIKGVKHHFDDKEVVREIMNS